jgi:hypothetical protein
MAATRVKPTGLWTERRLEFCLPLSASATPMMEAADTPETSVRVYETQKDSTVQSSKTACMFLRPF